MIFLDKLQKFVNKHNMNRQQFKDAVNDALDGGGGGDGNLKSDGTVPMDAGYTPTGALDIGTKEYIDNAIASLNTFLTNNYTNNTDLANTYVSKDGAGDVTIAGDLTVLGGIDSTGVVTSLTTPTTNIDLTTKVYVDNALLLKADKTAVDSNTDRLNYSVINLINNTASISVPASNSVIPFNVEQEKKGTDFTSDLVANSITVNSNLTFELIGSINATQTGGGSSSAFTFELLINGVAIGDSPKVVLDEATAQYIVSAPRVSVLAGDVITFTYNTTSSNVVLQTTPLHDAINVTLTELIN